MNPAQQTRHWRKKNYDKLMLLRARQHARLKNLEINIDLSDIAIPETCPYLGVPLTQVTGEGHKVPWTNASVDRIDSTKGYIKGNVQVISRQANLMKNNATQEQLVVFARNILKGIN